jgi:hypothetical protein
MHFYKLNRKIDASEYSVSSLLNTYAINGKGIEIYRTSEYSDIIMDLIPERYRNDFFVRKMKINYNIPPHTDSYLTTTINFYIQPSNCITKFFDYADSSLGERKTNQTTGRTFKEEDLNFSCSFVAEKDDVYILNVSMPHSVMYLDKPPVDRIALTLQSEKYSFNEICEMLRETGYLDVS